MDISNYYLVLIVFVCMSMMTLVVMTIEDTMLTKKHKRQFYYTYVTIAVASLAELFGVYLNGAGENMRALHEFVKCADYILTPSAGFFLIQTLRPGKYMQRFLFSILSVNILIQVISLFTGWTFYLDENNYYRHGSLYICYVLIYCLMILAVIIQFYLFGVRYKTKNRLGLFLILFLIFVGITVQEISGGELRMSYIALAISAILLHLYYAEFINQDRESVLEHQRELLETDPLTGVKSRYAYNNRLLRLSARKLTPERTFFMIDINGLKVINDTYGHEKGDALIKKAADVINAIFETGEVYRTGGDEFVVFLKADAEYIKLLKERLNVESEKWIETSGGVTGLSYGVARASDYPEMDVEKIISVADKAMYDNKAEFYRRTGRKRRGVDYN